MSNVLDDLRFPGFVSENFKREKVSCPERASVNFAIHDPNLSNYV